MEKYFFSNLNCIPANQAIYIYGAGEYGVSFRDSILKERKDISIVSFLDSHKSGNIDGIPIKDIKEISIDNELIIVTSIWWEEISLILYKLGINSFLVYLPQFSDLFVELVKKFFNRIDMKALSIRERINCDKIDYFLKREKPNTILEIGTNSGASSVYFAKYAEKIVTIDIQDYKVKDEIWDHFNVLEKIEFKKIENNTEKKKYVEALEFDFAFIDGDHSYEGVKFDFEITKKCGKILFHDYGYWEILDPNGAKELSAIKEFVDTLTINDESSVLEIRNPFALWKKIV